MSRNPTHARQQQPGYGTAPASIRNFVVVHDGPDMRRIIHHVRNLEVDPETFRRQLSKRLNIPLSDLSLVPEEKPRTSGGESPEQIARLERQLERYRELDEISDDDDLSAFVTIYRRLLACGCPPKLFISHAIEKFIATELPSESQDNDTQEDCSWDTQGDQF